jgi:class 3 adenylate cyclase/predicted ATPase
MTDVRELLESIGLGQYAEVFIKNDIDCDVLAQVDEQDLEKLGVSFGHRKKILKAVSENCSPISAAGRSVEVERPTISPTIKAERRHLTIMFCDLVGSTALSEQLDPEDLRQILRGFQRCCENAIRSCGGHIARFLGDGVLAYFGFPASREGDAERAVTTALKIIEIISMLNTSQRLRVRIGIASGVVVAGDLIGAGAAAEFALVGAAPNLAARLQALARPNQILISAGTRRLLGRLFDLADLGEHHLHGFEQAIGVWRVLGPSAVATRFEALHTPHLTPLVGRDQELAFLQDKLAKAEQGLGQLVLLAGEPGIGKSRLTMELVQRLPTTQSQIWFQCSSHHTSSAWYPVIRYLERAARVTDDAAPEEKLHKLETMVGELIQNPNEEIALLAALLSIPLGSRYPPVELTPQQQKNRTFTALLTLLKAQAEKHPAVVIFEDVHWIDPTTLELLERLRDHVKVWRMLIIALFRPELTLPWMASAHVSSLVVDRLDREQAASMTQLLSTDLPAELTQQIVAKSDGVPLFIEEMTTAVVNSQTRSNQFFSDFRSSTTVPDTLHESLMARLDQVAPMKTVAQIAAVIGREFSLDLLQAVAHLSEDELRSALDRLLAMGLLFRSGHPGDRTFTFKHALVQEEAYASLLRDERRKIHLRTANVLCADLRERGNASPEIIAHHYTHAGEVRAAIDYWTKAGRRAAERFLFVEASTHFQMALQLLSDLPSNLERDGLELELQYSLGNTLIAEKGFSAPDTGAAFNRALELCQKFEGSFQTTMVIHGIVGFQATKGEFEECRGLGEALVQQARLHGDPTQKLIGHRALGMAQFLIGELQDARLQLGRSLDLFDAHPPSAALIFPQDIRSTAQAFLGLACVVMGSLKEGFSHAQAAVNRATQLRHPHSLCYVLTFLAGAHVICREPERVLPIVDRSIALSVEYGFPLWSAGGQMLRGWARVETGELEQGIAEIRRGIADLEITGALIWVQFGRYLLAQALANAERRCDALNVVDKTLAAIPNDSRRWYQAELYRLKGDLSVDAPASVVEAHYEKAIATAASQGARLWELRATNALAMFRRSRTGAVDMRDRLAPLYESFAGEDVGADLQETKELLE